MNSRRMCKGCDLNPSRPESFVETRFDQKHDVTLHQQGWTLSLLILWNCIFVALKMPYWERILLSHWQSSSDKVLLKSGKLKWILLCSTGQSCDDIGLHKIAIFQTLHSLGVGCEIVRCLTGNRIQYLHNTRWVECSYSWRYHLVHQDTRTTVVRGPTTHPLYYKGS